MITPASCWSVSAERCQAGAVGSMAVHRGSEPHGGGREPHEHSTRVDQYPRLGEDLWAMASATEAPVERRCGVHTTGADGFVDEADRLARNGTR